MEYKLRFRIHSGFDLDQNPWFLKALFFEEKNESIFVIGLSAYSFSLTKSTAEHCAFVLAIDHIEEVKQYVPEAIQFDATEQYARYSVAELKMRHRYRVNLLPSNDRKNQASKWRKESFEVLGVIEPDIKIRENDKLVLMGKEEGVNKLLETN